VFNRCNGSNRSKRLNQGNDRNQFSVDKEAQWQS
jgi:hypothetical protein